MIDKGAKVDEVNNVGSTALIYAAFSGHPEIVRMLLDKGADMTKVNMVGSNTALTYAAKYGDPKSLRLLLERSKQRSVDEGTALNQAVRYGRKDNVSMLLEMGIGPDTKNIYGEIPLHITIIRLSQQKAQAKMSPEEKERDKLYVNPEGDYSGVIKLLLSQGANVNIKDGSGRNAMAVALETNNDELVKLLQEMKAEANYVDPWGKKTLLMKAVESNNPESVKLLLAQGAEVDAVDSDGNTALLLALKPSSSDYKKDQIEIVKALVRAGANVNIVGGFGLTALTKTNDIQFIKEILKSPNVNVNLVVGDTTPLIRASRNGEIEIVQALLDKGADISLRNNEGKDAIEAAGKYEKVASLLKKTLAERRPDAVALKKAIQRGDAIAFSDLLRKDHYLASIKFGQGETPLHLAVKQGSQNMVKTLLLMGADPKEKDDKGISPLELAEKSRNNTIISQLNLAMRTDESLDKEFIEAAKKGNLATLKALLEQFPSRRAKGLSLVIASFNGNISVINFLLDNGADVNAKVFASIIDDRIKDPDEAYGLLRDGTTALLFAAENDQITAANLLLNRGADVNIGSCSGDHAPNCGTTPLMYASYRGNLELVKSMLKAGANVNASNYTGETAIVNAIYSHNAEVVKTLLENGAKVDFFYGGLGDGPSETVLGSAENTGNSEIMLLIRRALNLKDPPLIVAVMQNDAALVNKLIQQGENINETNDNGETALYYAAKFGRADIVALLLNKGAKVNIQDKNGKTALVMAVIANSLNVVSLLMEYHADANIGTPLYYAVENYGVGFGGNGADASELTELLVRHGADINIIGSDSSGRNDPLVELALESGHFRTAYVMLRYGWKEKRNVEKSTKYLSLALHSDTIPELIELLIDHGADVNRTFPAAVQTCNPNVVKVFIEHGADLTDALSFAIRPRDIWSPEVAKILLDHGVKIQPHKAYVCDVVGGYNMIPGYGTAEENVSLVVALIQHGADPNETCSVESHTPKATALGWAKIHKKEHQQWGDVQSERYDDEIIKYLTSIGAKE